MEQPDWLEWAWRELGVREQPGKRDNPRILAMFKDSGHAKIVRDEVAWCAAFVGACLERSGRQGTRSLMARSYLQWGVPIAEPRLGALAVLSRGGDPALGHVGFVVGETGDQLQLLGGNQAQQVNVQSFPKSRLIELRWPATAPAAEVAEPEPGRTLPHDHDDEETVANPVFEDALRHVLEMEGGFSDDPHDPGGATNRGITIGVFAKWIGTPLDERSRPKLVQRLKKIPDSMVREIYETRYWHPAGCDSMPAPLAFLHFDAAVNHGVGAAIRMLQQAVGTEADGEIGPATRAAITGMPLRTSLVRYAELRRERYRALPHFWRFGRGWLKRVDLTLAESARLLHGHAPTTAPSTSVTTREGDNSMPNDTRSAQTESKWWGQSITIWGVIVTAVSTVLPVIGPLIGIDLTSDMIELIGQQVLQIAQAIGGLVGTLMAIYGRVRAVAPIERRAVSLKL